MMMQQHARPGGIEFRPYIRNPDAPAEGELSPEDEWARYERKNEAANLRYDMEKDSIDWRYDPSALAAKPRIRSAPRPGERGYKR